MTIKTITHEISRAHTEAAAVSGPCDVPFESFAACLPLDLLCGRGSIQEAADARARIDALLVAAGYERVDAAMLQAETYERLAEDIGQDLDWNGDQLWSGDHRRLALMTDDALYIETDPEFHEVFRDARKAAKLTQAQIAHQLGITSQAVGYWERGQAMPGGDALLALLRLMPGLAESLGVPR